MRFIGALDVLVISSHRHLATSRLRLQEKQVFKPTSAHSIVVEALEKKKSSEALAKRLWMVLCHRRQRYFEPRGCQRVLGPARRDEADEAFASIDVDNNGDISLDEMILKIVQTAENARRL